MRRMLLLPAIAIAACATPYQENTAWSVRGGVTSEVLSEDVYAITAKGNSYTSNERITHFIFLRAAQVAQSEGAVGFVLVSAADTGAEERATGVGISGGYTTIISAPLYKPGQEAVVRLVREPVPDELAGDLMRADAVIAELGPLYLR